MSEEITPRVPEDTGISPPPSVASLFLSFLGLGCVALGGPAMIVHIRRMVVQHRRWVNDAAFREGIALCQILPGATAMQVAAYAGLRARGVRGALAAYVGFGLPAFLFISGMAACYAAGRELALVVAAFGGLQAVVVAVVASATVTFGLSTIKGWRESLIAAGGAALLIAGLHPAAAVGIAAVAGLVLFARRMPAAAASTAPALKTRWKQLASLTALATAFFAVLFFTDRHLFDLALLMARVDAVAFGGGFASVPLLYHEVVTSLAWLDARTFSDGIALGQITPGPIVITSAFVGYLLRGPAGAAVAAVGIFTPSFLFLTAAAPYYHRLQRSALFWQAGRGVLCSFVGLLAATTWRFGVAVPWDWRRGLLAAAAFTALILKVNVAWVILTSAVVAALLL